MVSPGVSWMVMSNESPVCVAKRGALAFGLPFVLRARVALAGASAAKTRLVRNRTGGGNRPSHDASV